MPALGFPSQYGCDPAVRSSLAITVTDLEPNSLQGNRPEQKEVQSAVGLHRLDFNMVI